MRSIDENTLFYGDNLEVMRKYIKDETVDLCYIDPPFNSKRNYNQIYNNIGSDDRAQAQAFIDTWSWDEYAIKGYDEIRDNERGRFTVQTVDLITGLQRVLKKGSLLAYLVSMTLRITEIYRVLKPTGTFYLHCDPTASHYLKLVLDAVFCSQGGDFLNEIVWCYSGGGVPKKDFARKHDIIFRYSKTDEYIFYVDEIRQSYSPEILSRPKSSYAEHSYSNTPGRKTIGWDLNPKGKYPDDWFYMPIINPGAKERLGYPTQKPEALLERLIAASSREGDMVLDAYSGCGTSIAVAERLKRKWIGIDITYQSIALVLRRLEDTFGKEVASHVHVDGIPRDVRSAFELAHKKDDRVRKEFEKWAVLTYSNNRARINEKKGGDQGIDGTAFFLTGHNDNAKIVFQVKSGNVGRGDVSKFNNDRAREGAELAVFLTLQPPTKGMRDEAIAAGMYKHPLMERSYPRVQIVTIEELLEQHKRLGIPLSIEVLKQAQRIQQAEAEQPELGLG